MSGLKPSSMNKNALLYLVIAIASFAQVSAQSSNPNAANATSTAAAAAVADPAMPKDPNAAMLLAARVNGLPSKAGSRLC